MKTKASREAKSSFQRAAAGDLFGDGEVGAGAGGTAAQLAAAEGEGGEVEAGFARMAGFGKPKEARDDR